MPVTIPMNLPAREHLEKENIFVMSPGRAAHQDIRPLQIIILNLMPTKIQTETQILRLLSNTPLQVEITLLHMESHASKNTSAEHLGAFYSTFDRVKYRKFDGMIITGAPVETLEFEKVDYWPELTRILDWSKSHVFSTLYICWGAQAGLYHHFGIQKYLVGKKITGVFQHEIQDIHTPIVRGFDAVFPAPHSRYTEVLREDVADSPDLKIIAESAEAGVYLVVSDDGRHVFITGHPEYDPLTLKGEYERDRAKGMDAELPKHYFPGDDPSKRPIANWRSHAHLLYANWLNYYVYQATPFDLEAIGEESAPGMVDDWVI